MKLENPQLSWEAFKYLSKNVLTEKELDIYYFLINQYIETKNTSTLNNSISIQKGIKL